MSGPDLAQQLPADEAQRLIAQVLDGPPDQAALARLVRAAAADPALRRLLRQHILISEVASQMTAPERGAEAFAAGLEQRRLAEADGAVFTARVLAQARAERLRRMRAAGSFAFEVVGLSTAATLLIGLLSLLAHGAAGGTRAHAPVALDDDARSFDAPSMLVARDRIFR